MAIERGSHPQLDALSEATAKAELLARARARQIDHLEAELQRVTAEAARQTQSAAQAESEAKQSTLNAELREKQALEQCQQAMQQAQTAERTITTLKTQLEKIAAELADAQLQLEWQAQRIRDLEDSSTVGRVLRQHDQQIEEMRESHESERQRLMQDLEDASLKIQELQACHRRAASSGKPQAQDDPWQLLFEEAEDANILQDKAKPRTLAAASQNKRAKAAQIAAAELAIRIQGRQKMLCTSSRVSVPSSSPYSSSSPSYVTPTTTATNSSSSTPRQSTDPGQSPGLSESGTCASYGSGSTATLDASFQRLAELVQGLLSIHEWRKAHPCS